MTAFPSTTHVAATLRDLPSSLPYTRLFGAHFNSIRYSVPFGTS